MFGLPSSTEVNRRVTKEKLYAKTILTPQLQDMIKSQVEMVIWRNKLADSTMGIGAGESIKEIEIFEVQLRQQGLDKRILHAITRAIPYKILFVLTFNNEGQVWIEASGTFYNTGWLPLEGLAFRFEGLNLDAMYENLARQVADGWLGTAGNIDEAVERDKLKRKLERDIAALERKVLWEKQFNRQVELYGELKTLKEELRLL